MTDQAQFELFDSQVEDQIRALKQENARIEDEIKPKMEEISENKRKIEHLEKYLGITEGGGMRRTKRTTEISRLAVQILREKGEPMHYTEIMDEIQTKKKFEIPGKDPKSNMTAHLSTDTRIVRVDRGTYGLKEWQKKDPEDESSEPF